MEAIQTLVNSIVNTVYDDESLFTKEELTEEYTAQIVEKDASSLVEYLKHKGLDYMASEVKKLAK